MNPEFDIELESIDLLEALILILEGVCSIRNVCGRKERNNTKAFPPQLVF